MVFPENLGRAKNFFPVRISSQLRPYPEGFLGTCKKWSRYRGTTYVSFKHRKESKCFTHLVLLLDVSRYDLMVGLCLFCLGDALIEDCQ